VNELAQLQLDFQQHVLGERRDGFASRSVVASAVADSAARVNVYTHAYAARLAEVLGNDFHGLRLLVGDEAFGRLAHAYIEATRSQHYNVRWYGQHLADFLKQNEPWSREPALAEMASLEWSIGLSFDAPDQPSIDVAALESIAPEQWPQLGLKLHPSVQTLSMQFNTGIIRRAVDRELALPAVAELAAPETWIVSRRDTAVRYRVAPADESAALQSFVDGAALAEVCALLCDWHAEDQVAMRAASLLKQWLYDQWVVQLSGETRR
jgi:hypothetical protein